MPSATPDKEFMTACVRFTAEMAQGHAQTIFYDIGNFYFNIGHFCIFLNGLFAFYPIFVYLRGKKERMMISEIIGEIIGWIMVPIVVLLFVAAFAVWIIYWLILLSYKIRGKKIPDELKFNNGGPTYGPWGPC